eukprot:CAMPEP_0183720572 /NCGR_PEP_ID=MMETSP0737-20130205/13149_1 /TAXON_ID=385413 /ORGANISM="Thalassiosira miniscula, Strain CCMP1093" /LENGTH=208 /DNA_ID=CAMNT_0025950453 /DNA_START=141 /DNA_END=767 /DNA_ORIENTATION=+
MTPNRLLITLTTLLILVAPVHANTCNIGWDNTCDPVAFTATSKVFFDVQSVESNKDSDTFEAEVIYYFHDENITQPMQAYAIGEPIGLDYTHTFTQEGYYNVRYEVIFGSSAAACTGQTLGSSKVVMFERTPNRCVWGAKTPEPTPKPTVSLAPSTSAQPTAPSVVRAQEEAEAEALGEESGSTTRRPLMILFSLGLAVALGGCSLWF